MQIKLCRIFLFLKACVLIAVMMRRKLGEMLNNVLTNQPPPPDQGRRIIQRRPRAPRIQPAQNVQQDNCQTPRRSRRIRRPPVRLNYDR